MATYGIIAPLVAERTPVSRMVLVNAMVPRPGESAGEWWHATGQDQARAEHYRRLGLELPPVFDLGANGALPTKAIHTVGASDAYSGDAQRPPRTIGSPRGIRGDICNAWDQVRLGLMRFTGWRSALISASPSHSS